ncbi:MAG: hypothetical protein V1835_03555 [Candidatus Micrarchaeota archaeon]
MGKPSRAERETMHAQIETYAGNTILPLNHEVWVLVGGTAVRKKVADLKEGVDRVLDVNTSIQVSLADIKKALIRHDAEYQAAHSLLHYFPGEKAAMPKLQEYLLSALEHWGFDRDFVQSRIGTSQAVDVIQQHLNAREIKIAGLTKKASIGLTRSGESIEHWLKGTTTLPSNMGTLRALSGLYPQKFAQLFGHPARLKVRYDETGVQETEVPLLLWAHDHWSGAHRVLRRWIAPRSDKASENESKVFEFPKEEIADRRVREEGGPKAKRSWGVERRLIYDKLIEPIHHEINQDYAFNLVKKVVRVNLKTARNARKEGGKKGPVLTRGVVSADKISPATIPGSKVREKTMRDLFRESRALSLILEGAFDKLKIDYEAEEHTQRGSLIRNTIHMIGDVRRLPENSTYPFVRIIEGRQVRSEISREVAMNVFDRAMESLATGEIDRLNDLEKGTMLKIMQREKELTSAIPVIEYIDEFRRRSFLHSLELEKGEFANKRFLKEHLDAIHVLIKKILAYGVNPHDILIPNRVGIYDIGGLRDFNEEVKSSSKLLMGTEFGHEPPLNRKEVLSSLASIISRPEQTEKLVTLMDRRNLVENWR